MLAADVKYMEMAVQTASRSVSEEDGRMHPNVGVVIAGAWGSVEAARNDDGSFRHAEKIALDRLDRIAKRADAASSTLYTTLEPCAVPKPGNKRDSASCAAAIVSSGIRRVAFAQLDARRSSRGAGIEFLLRHGVEVLGFPSHLANEVANMNEAFLTAQRPQGERERVAVIVSAFQENAFIAAVLQRVMTSLGARSFDCIVRLPVAGANPQAEVSQLAAVLENSHEYAAALVFPLSRANDDGELLHAATRFPRKITFVDVDPFPLLKPLPPNVTYVGYNNSIGARWAARFALKELAKIKRDKPRVLIVGADLQPVRHNRFERCLKKAMGPDCFVKQERGDFKRPIARQIAIDVLIPAERNGTPFHGVFATSDEMALGVLEVIWEGRLKTPPWVVGYDGIPEAVELLKYGGSQLRGTVVQNPQALAEAAVAALLATKRTKDGRLTLRPSFRGENDSESPLRRFFAGRNRGNQKPKAKQPARPAQRLRSRAR